MVWDEQTKFIIRMIEDNNNVYFLRKEYGDARKAKWQEENQDTKIEIDAWVKLAFSEGEEVEHMWVMVKKEKGGMFEGILDNEPIYLKNIKDGDKVVFERENIEAYNPE